jgi:hypothetical protein
MNYRKSIAALVAFLGGAYFFLQFILPDKVGALDLQKYHGAISDGFILVGVMTIGLGLLSLLLNHGGRLLRKRQGWSNSLALLLGLFLMLGVCSYDWMIDYRVASEFQKASNLRRYAELVREDYKDLVVAKERTLERAGLLDVSLAEMLAQHEQLVSQLGSKDLVPVEFKEFQTLHKRLREYNVGLQDSCIQMASCVGQINNISQLLPEYALALRFVLEANNKLGVVKQTYRILFEGVFIALGSAIFSLLGFYIVTAAFRAFRVRSFESGLMMLAALLVMLGQISLGILIWPGLADVRLWLLEIPNTAAFRAIELGAAVAGLVLAFRMWLSIESRSFSGKE